MVIDLFVRHRKVGLDRFLIENYTCDKITLEFQSSLTSGDLADWGSNGPWIPAIGIKTY